MLLTVVRPITLILGGTPLARRAPSCPVAVTVSRASPWGTVTRRWPRRRASSTTLHQGSHLQTFLSTSETTVGQKIARTVPGFLSRVCRHAPPPRRGGRRGAPTA